MNTDFSSSRPFAKRSKAGWPATAEDTWTDAWSFVAAECPVTAADGSQTRIDALLEHKRARNVYICMECKRPHPKYKKWVFFDRESSVAAMPDGQMSIENLFVGKRPAQREDIQRTLARVSTTTMPLFSFYLEAAVRRDGSASSTETIEKAFYQLMKGQSGLMAKLEASNLTGYARSIPIVVTTAELVEARFDPTRVSIESGMIAQKDFELHSLDYCAVNYRADDNLSLRNLSPHERSPGANDLMNAQIRTVFVARATAVNRLLNWTSECLVTRGHL